MDVRMNKLSQNFQPMGLRKMDVKIKQGPLIQKATLGNIANKPMLRNAVSLKDNILKKDRAANQIFKRASTRGKDKENKVPAKINIIKEVKQHVYPEEPMEVEEVAVEELSIAFSSQMLDVEDIDSGDASNAQLVFEYVNDIYKYLWKIEASNEVQKAYLEGRRVTPKMRAILIDWLVQVHLKFTLLQETLYLTVAILDRYLQAASQTPKEELQLVGVTAMFIASKYEEMYIPEIGDFSYITDKAFSRSDIRKMEVKMLKTLNCYISYPLPLHFLRRNSKAGHVDGFTHTLAKYLMELTICDYYFCHVHPSEIAAAALYLAMRLKGREFKWNETLTFYSKYSEKDIAPIVSKLSALVIRSSASKQQAIRNKYKSSKFLNISEMEELSPNCKELKCLSEGIFN